MLWGHTPERAAQVQANGRQGICWLLVMSQTCYIRRWHLPWIFICLWRGPVEDGDPYGHKGWRASPAHHILGCFLLSPRHRGNIPVLWLPVLCSMMQNNAQLLKVCIMAASKTHCRLCFCFSHYDSCCKLQKKKRHQIYKHGALLIKHHLFLPASRRVKMIVLVLAFPFSSMPRCHNPSMHSSCIVIWPQQLMMPDTGAAVSVIGQQHLESTASLANSDLDSWWFRYGSSYS